jgi:two-component system, cell cycle response regulator DivK
MTSYIHADGTIPACTALARANSYDKLLVLTIEDHEDTRLLLRILLERRGMRVIEAGDGVAGISAAEKLHPDLILMDWSLPRLDGLAALRLIRGRPDLRLIPVIFLSAHAGPASREAAMSAGCSEYIVKPFEIDQLDRVLRRQLLLRKMDSFGTNRLIQDYPC